MPDRPLVVLTSLPMTQITFSLVTAIIGVGNLGMMPPVGHLYWSASVGRNAVSPRPFRLERICGEKRSFSKTIPMVRNEEIPHIFTEIQ